MARFTSKELSVILLAVSLVTDDFHFFKMNSNMVSIEEIDGNLNYSIGITKSERGFHVYGLYPNGKVSSLIADSDTLSIAIQTTITKVIHNCN